MHGKMARTLTRRFRNMHVFLHKITKTSFREFLKILDFSDIYDKIRWVSRNLSFFVRSTFSRGDNHRVYREKYNSSIQTRPPGSDPG